MILRPLSAEFEGNSLVIQVYYEVEKTDLKWWPSNNKLRRIRADLLDTEIGGVGLRTIIDDNPPTKGILEFIADPDPWATTDPQFPEPEAYEIYRTYRLAKNVFNREIKGLNLALTFDSGTEYGIEKKLLFP